MVEHEIEHRLDAWGRHELSRIEGEMLSQSGGAFMSQATALAARRRMIRWGVAAGVLLVLGVLLGWWMAQGDGDASDKGPPAAALTDRM